MTDSQPLSPCCKAGVLNYYRHVFEGKTVSAKYRCRQCKNDVPDPSQPVE
jgi:hypothetical protein